MTEPAAEDRPTRVGIAVVRRDHRYLIRQRLPGTAMAGYWEFPGGKCEPGETPEDATLRECLEEIGLAVAIQRLRRQIPYRYPHAWVELSYFDCTTLDPHAEPEPSTGFRWVAAKDLPALRFPEANEPILAELAREAAARSSG